MLRIQRQLCYPLFFGVAYAYIKKVQVKPYTVRHYIKPIKSQEQTLPPVAQHNTTVFFIAGVRDLMVRKPKEALTNLQRALKLVPRNTGIHVKLAHLLQQYPQLAAQVATTSWIQRYTAMALAPHNLFYCLSAVMMRIDQGGCPQAMQIDQRIFQKIPHEAVLDQLGQRKEVLAQWEKAHSLCPATTARKNKEYE